MKLAYIDALGVYLALFFLVSAFVPWMRQLPEEGRLLIALAPVAVIQLWYIESD